MLEWLTGGATTDQLAQGFQLSGVQLPLELEVEAKARKRKGVGEQQFCLQSG
jgi:hypothetical protein